MKRQRSQLARRRDDRRRLRPRRENWSNIYSNPKKSTTWGAPRPSPHPSATLRGNAHKDITLAAPPPPRETAIMSDLDECTGPSPFPPPLQARPSWKRSKGGGEGRGCLHLASPVIAVQVIRAQEDGSAGKQARIDFIVPDKVLVCFLPFLSLQTRVLLQLAIFFDARGSYLETQLTQL